MRRLTNTIKRVTIGFLCLLLLISLMFSGTQKVKAGGDFNRIEITTDRPLHQYTDIAAFLKGVQLIIPAEEFVESFDYSLMYIKSNGVPVEVTSGKAEARRYVFSISITLIDGCNFGHEDSIYATLNESPITSIDPMHEGSSTMSGRWDIYALPRYKVTFNTDGGAPVPPVQWIVEGTQVKVPKQPSKAGHEFLGWWHDVPKFSEEWDFSQGLYQNLPLIAHWKALPTEKPITTATTTPIDLEPTTTPIELEPITTTLETIEPITTDETIEHTTVLDADVSDTSYSEPSNTTLSSNTKKGDHSFLTLFYILGGVAVLAVLGVVIHLIAKRKQ